MLSMYDPIYVGIDEFGHPVYTRIIYKNLLAAGEPGGGKSGLLNTLAAHAALSVRTRLRAVRRQASRTRHVGRHRRRIRRPRPRPRHHHPAPAAEGDGQPLRLAAAPTAAARSSPATASTSSPRSSTRSPLYSTVLGTEQQQREFVALFRDLVARGRAAAMPVIAATQRPSVDIIPKSLRDLFGYRAAFRCTSTGSSDIILGDGWSEAGFSATDIAPSNPGECLADRRRRRPPADQGRLPDRRRHHRPGRLRRLDPPHRRPVPTAGPATAVA